MCRSSGGVDDEMTTRWVWQAPRVYFVQREKGRKLRINGMYERTNDICIQVHLAVPRHAHRRHTHRVQRSSARSRAHGERTAFQSPLRPRLPHPGPQLALQGSIGARMASLQTPCRAPNRSRPPNGSATFPRDWGACRRTQEATEATMHLAGVSRPVSQTPFCCMSACSVRDLPVSPVAEFCLVPAWLAEGWVELRRQ